LRLGQGLALFLGHHRADLIRAFAQQIGGFFDDAAAVIGGLRLPELEAFLGGCERGIEIAGGCMWKMCERLLRRRIEHVLAATAVAVVPLAVDVESKLRVHGVLAFGFFGNSGGVPIRARSAQRIGENGAGR
jgi:hypothetical protein